jgi:hypothetical protein
MFAGRDDLAAILVKIPCMHDAASPCQLLSIIVGVAFLMCFCLSLEAAWDEGKDCTSVKSAVGSFGIDV